MISPDINCPGALIWFIGMKFSGNSPVVIDEKGFSVHLNVVDTPGFGDLINNSSSWSSIAKFVDDQLESYFCQENQARRQNIQDTRVHACLYFIPPTGQS